MLEFGSNFGEDDDFGYVFSKSRKELIVYLISQLKRIKYDGAIQLKDIIKHYVHRWKGSGDPDWCFFNYLLWEDLLPKDEYGLTIYPEEE
jgi:hypothetical protein